MNSRPRVVNIDCEIGNYDYERERLAALGADLLLQPARARDETPVQAEESAIRACAGADVVVIERSDKAFPARVIASLDRCRGIVHSSVGFEGLDLPAASRLGIVAANAADFCTEEVSDHSAAHLHASARRIMVMDRRVRAGGWQDFPPTGSLRRLSNLTLGLVGLGRIACAVARKMSGFRLRIVACDPYLKAPPPGVEAEMVEMEQLLRTSDLVSLHVPLSPATRGLIGESALRSMKASAILVNTSRGGIVDQEALIKALREHWIAGAGLDVTAEEPLGPSSPLRAFDQVIVTPHYAASSTDSLAHLHRTTMNSVEALLRGYWPLFSPLNPGITPRFPLRPLAGIPSSESLNWPVEGRAGPPYPLAATSAKLLVKYGPNGSGLRRPRREARKRPGPRRRLPAPTDRGSEAG